MIESMPDWLYNTVFPINRWLHMVATGLLVGGVLFYEFVIPQALDELKDEHQMSVFGRVRWYFSKVVYFSALIILLSGALAAWSKWGLYQKSHALASPGFWFTLHAGVGLASLAIALRLTLSPYMPPLSWMRMNFVLLLVVIFLGGVARHVQVAPGTGLMNQPVDDEPFVSRSRIMDLYTTTPTTEPDATTEPATQPAE